MQSYLKRKIEIETQSKDECMDVGRRIHEQLCVNPDYINNNIVLNCTDIDNVVRLYIFNECKDIPMITI